MNKSDYDKYYKKGGTYVIPVEIFNELFNELERLKKREQECIDHYLIQCKYASEMEFKYITANNIIKEFEKWLEDKDKNALQDDNYWEVLDKLQELKGSNK